MSKTFLVARQVRLQQWADDIRSCNNRPVGTTVTDWCNEHGIKRSAYYWRLSAVRKACLDTVDQAGFSRFDESLSHNNPSFVEIKPIDVYEPDHSSSQGAVIYLGHAALELNENISDSFLQRIMEAVYHAK